MKEKGDGQKNENENSAAVVDGDMGIVYDDYGRVRMGNEGASKTVGIGDICLETSVGCKLLFKNVRHVSDIHLNLISTIKLDDDGYTNQFGEGK